MPDRTTTITLALGAVMALYIVQRALRSRTSYPLPPGPPGLPWVGHLFFINVAAPWKTYAKWAEKYGDIVHFRLMGKDMIVVNSEKIAKDLLDRRSRNYSDRPYLITTEMCGLGFHSALMPYGDRWRLHRRFFHQTFRLDAVPRFLPLQHRKACHFLRRLFESPQQLSGHVVEYTASVILNSTYNYDPKPGKDELVDIAMDALKIMVVATRTDVGIVAGAFPLLFHLPSWLPGMSFKRQIDMAREFSVQYLERPFQYFLQREPSDNVAPSMLGDALQQMEERGVLPEGAWIEGLKDASGTVFMAAAESSECVLMSFFLMMMMNPEVQEKAQAQIDDVVGRGRLPTMDDRPLLPFVDAILWETFRCNPVTPLSLPHVSVDDDVYDGYHIPKNTCILANVWSMGHDESRYPNPHEFMPERFLNDDGSLKPIDIEYIPYGFGRRSCVGRHFADASLWGMIAKVLSVFKILRALDENGNEVPVERGVTSGILVHPLPFKCRIIPRTPGMDLAKLEQLIASSTV